MNWLVLFFFIHVALAATIVGGVFMKKGGNVAKYFGLGLLIGAIGFASWGLAVMMPDNLTIFGNIGSVLVLISFIFFLWASTDNVSEPIRNLILALGIMLVVVTFIVRSFIFPTDKFISDEGILIFNLAPFVQFLYVTILVLVVIPLIEKVAAMFKAGYATFIKYALGIQVIGGIILITSADELSLLAAGWAIGLAYFALWTTLLFCKNIWRK